MNSMRGHVNARETTPVRANSRFKLSKPSLVRNLGKMVQIKSNRVEIPTLKITTGAHW